MALPRRARLTLGALSAALLFGALGLAWWWWRHRAGYQPAVRLRRTRAALVIAGVGIIAIGSAGRLATVFHPTPTCSGRGEVLTARSASFDASLLGQEVATWPQTGIGLLYSGASDAHVCLARSTYYYVAVHTDNIAGARAMTFGDIVLTPPLNLSNEEVRGIAAHEARHRVQWAVGTAIAGPFAFPVAYAIADFFFPGSRNPFERQAGLEAGLYTRTGTGPVLGLAQLAVLCALGAVAVITLATVFHRRRTARRAGSPADKPQTVQDGLRPR